MRRNIGWLFLKTLRDYRGAILGYGLGGALYTGAMMAFYPSIQHFTGLDELMKSYPPALKALFVQSAWSSFGTVRGYLVLEFFSLAPLVFAIFACNAAAYLVAGEEEKATLDLLLSNPLPRWQLVLEKYAAMAISLLLICLLTAAGTAIGVAAIGEKFSWGPLLGAVLGLFALSLLFGSVTLPLTAFMGRRAAMGTGMGLLFTAYLWNSLSPLVASLEPYQKISPFYLYKPMDVLTNGLGWGDVSILLGLSALFLLISLSLFRRKDLGV